MGIVDKVEHALGMDKSGSGGSQGMGDRRTDGLNDYTATNKSGATNVPTAQAHHNIHSNSEYGAGLGADGRHHGLTEGQGIGDSAGRQGLSNTANQGVSSVGTQGRNDGFAPSISYPAGQRPAEADQVHHHHHTGTGAIGGAVAGHHEGHTLGGAAAGGLAGHEIGENHGSRNTTATGQQEGLGHKAERMVDMAPEQRASRDANTSSNY